MDCSPPGSSVPGIVQARILKWVAMPSSRGSSQPTSRMSSALAGGSSLIPGSGRSTGDGIGYPLQYSWASPVAQLIKNPPAMQNKLPKPPASRSNPRRPPFTVHTEMPPPAATIIFCPFTLLFFSLNFTVPETTCLYIYLPIICLSSECKLHEGNNFKRLIQQ